MNKSYDILGIGFAAIDDLVYVGAYPPADAKMPVRRRERQCGGLTMTALVAAARLGMRCAYGGVVGVDELSQFTARQFERAAIDTRWMARHPAAQVVYSTIIVDETNGGRTIFYDLAGAIGIQPDWPPEEAILAARVVVIDHLDGARAVRAIQLARAAGVAIVADTEYVSTPAYGEMMPYIDHLIIPAAFAMQYTGAPTPRAAAEALWTPARRLAAVTCGDAGVWWVDGDAPDVARHQPAFAVNPVDTTGCGDVFHGAYAAALVRGLPAAERMRYAAAAAALKATRPGAQTGVPNDDEVREMLRRESGV